MRRKYLLGVTVDREIVFGEFEITHHNGYPEFTASFNTVRPFKCDDVDLVEYFENFIYDIGKENAYDLCERNNCSPQNLPQILADECSDPRDALDCSLYPEEINVNDEWWYFESGSCGQHDTREDGMDEYVNESAYNLLHELWDKYHLKQVDEEVVEQVDKLIEILEEVDEEEWIADYISRNF